MSKPFTSNEYPTTIEALEEMASVDLAPLDKLALDNNASVLATLINKYLKIHNRDKLLYVKRTSDLKQLRVKLWLYYSGKQDFSEWGPQPLKLLKAEVNDFIEAHPEYVKEKNKMAYLDQRLEYLEQIIKTLHNRGFAIKSILDYLKFTSGIG